MTLPLVARYDHTGFVTRNMDASLAFWTGAFGLDATDPVDRGGPWVAEMTGVPAARLRIAHLTGPDIHLEFISFLSPEGSNIPPDPTALATGHICLRVPDPVACEARMLAFGGGPVGRMAIIGEGKIAGCRGVYLRDPGGVLVELLEDTSLAEFQPE